MLWGWCRGLLRNINEKQEKVAYINTGATNSTVDLATNIKNLLNMKEVIVKCLVMSAECPIDIECNNVDCNLCWLEFLNNYRE